MTDKPPSETPMHVAAHNALAATVEMYGALLRESERRERALLLNIQMLKQQLAEAKGVKSELDGKVFGHPGEDTRTRMTRPPEPA